MFFNWLFLTVWIRNKQLHIFFEKRNDCSDDKVKWKWAYKKITLFQPLIMIPIWSICSFFVLKICVVMELVRESLWIAFTWLLMYGICDFFYWKKAKEKHNVSWKEIYTSAQPWTLLSYYVVVICPVFVGVIICR